MRIGFVLPAPLEGDHVGLQAYTRLVAAAWTRAGHDVHVLGPAELRFEGVTWHESQAQPESDPVLTAGLKEFGEVYGRAYPMADALDLFARDVDVVECPDTEAAGYFHLLRRLWAPQARSAAFALRWHTDTVGAWSADGTPRHGLFRYTRQHMEEAVLRMADAWLLPTTATRRFLRRRVDVPTTPTIVGMYPGVAAGDRGGARSAELLFVGPLRRSAGVEVLATALGRVLERHAHTTARFLGDDWFDPLRGASMRSHLSRLLAGFGTRVQFEGGAHPDAAARALARASVVVLPSLERSVSPTAVQALGAGCLLVASDLVPMDERVHDTGAVFTCRAGSVDDLRGAIDRVLAVPTPRREALSAAAHGWVASHASADAFVAGLERRYSRVASAPRRIALPAPASRPRAEAPPAVPHTCAVIIPCRNMGETLPETLDSVFAATRVPDEVILVDYGTTDPGTLRVFEDWAPRVRLVRAACDTFGEARNAGAAAATSDVLVFLDADDLLDPHCFALGMEVFARCPHAGFVTTWVRTFGAGEKAWCPPTPHLPLELTRNVAVAFGMFRREAFDSSGGYKAAMRFGYEDWDVWIAMLARGWSGVTIAEPLFLYRWRPGSSLRSMSGATRASMQEQLLQLNPQVYAAHHRDVILMLVQQATEETDAMAAYAERIASARVTAVTIYGASQWGRVLCQELRRRGVRVPRFVDGNTALHDTRVDEATVTTLDAALADGDTLFAIGSMASVDPIRQRIHARATALGLSVEILS